MSPRDPKTLVDALLALREQTERGFTFLDRKLAPEFWSFARLVGETERRALALLDGGLSRGDRVALILPEGRDFVLTFLAAVRAGIVPVPMYPPVSLARAAAYLETTRAILQSCGARHLVTTVESAPLASQLVGGDGPLRAILTTEQLASANIAPGGTLPSPSADDTCFLQYTSGSTALPKGVVVSHANVVANGLAIMREGLDSDPARDRGLSWLPLYHDMGLVGFVLAPLMVGVPVVFVPTLSFVKQPSIWLRLVSEYRATITFGPNFAYNLCTKRSQDEQPLDLSCLRVLGCGAEPIHPATMRRFLEHYRPHGLDPRALIACYGMAEATLAISFERYDEQFRTARIDREHYQQSGRARVLTADDLGDTLEVVSCGRRFPGHELCIADEHGRALEEGAIGEVLLRGPSATRGYFRDEAASRELWRGGWLHTGDLGFMLDSRLYISGRKKDLVIINGRNYYPQAIEWEVEQLRSIRAGTAVAFGSCTEAGERLVVVAEAAPGTEVAALRSRIQRRIAEALGIGPGVVLIAKPSSVPRTTSGKIQRAKTRVLFEMGALAALEDQPPSLSQGARAPSRTDRTVIRQVG